VAGAAFAFAIDYFIETGSQYFMITPIISSPKTDGYAGLGFSLSF
jgi:hypothetical protein